MNLPKGFILDKEPQMNLPEGFVLDSQSTRPSQRGATGTWTPNLEGRLREQYPKSMTIAQNISDIVTPVLFDYAKNIGTGDVSNLQRGTLEGMGGLGGSMVGGIPGGIMGYAGGKKLADIVDVGLLGKPYEDLPKTLIADYLLNKTPASTGGIEKYHPQNMLIDFLKQTPERGTISGEFNQTGRDIIDALSLQTIGEMAKAGVEKSAPAIKKAYGFVKSHIPWKTQRNIEQMAGDQLRPMIENIEENPIYSKTYKESRALEKEIPNVKYTLGQASGEPEAIMAERTLARGGVGATPVKHQLQRVQGGLAGREYVQSHIPPQEEGIDELIKGVKEKQKLLKNRLNKATQKYDTTYANVRPQGNKDTVNYRAGQEIFDKAKGLKGKVYKQAAEKYDKVPNLLINTEELLDDVLQLKDEFVSSGQEMSHFPNTAYNNLLNRISTVDETGQRLSRQIPFQELRGIRSSIKKNLRGIMSSENYDAVLGEYSRRLTNDNGSGIIEKALNQVEKINPEAGKAYTEANKFYRDVYIPSFRQRTVGSVLTPSSTNAPSKYDYTAIPDKFTKNIDTAKDYTRVFGHGDKEIKDVMMNEMLNDSLNDTTKQLNIDKASAWYGKNRGVLKELGIEGDFGRLIKSQQSLDSASQNLSGFNKSILAKVLNADPQQAIDVAMSGNTKNTGAAMRSIIQSLPSDKTPVGVAAKKGLQKAFVDYIFDKSQKQLASDVAEEVGKSPIVNIQKRGALLQQFDPALKELFKSEPQKYAALRNYQKNMEVIQRNFNSPFGGGSDTKELLAADSKRVMGVLAQGFGAKVKIFRILSGYYENGLKAKVNQIMERALLDPDYAFTLVKATSNPTLFKQRMDNHLVELGAYGLGGRMVPIKEDIRQQNEQRRYR